MNSPNTNKSDLAIIITLAIGIVGVTICLTIATGTNSTKTVPPVPTGKVIIYTPPEGGSVIANNAVGGDLTVTQTPAWEIVSHNQPNPSSDTVKAILHCEDANPTSGNSTEQRGKYRPPPTNTSDTTSTTLNNRVETTVHIHANGDPATGFEVRFMVPFGDHCLAVETKPGYYTGTIYKGGGLRIWSPDWDVEYTYGDFTTGTPHIRTPNQTIELDITTAGSDPAQFKRQTPKIEWAY